MMAGEVIGCAGLSEPGVGSDFGGLEMGAKRADGGWILRTVTSGACSLTNGVVLDRAWGAALCLFVLVLAFTVVARWVGSKASTASH